ncbi:pyruvate oxidase [Thermoflavimicrobium dichotomicum]|uniref:Pyruvate oxidase n=1 Tax=Thermoflavimicrobium dichotomicum TaxID=46223 RepID=A0A1I3PXN7_9BACL|nr:pyruvate oxidase [Thermoflavimicrobium dichotomicum]
MIKQLEAWGVDTIFGMPGVFNIPLLQAIEKSKIRFYLVRHEEGAAFMASAYAKASNRLGVCLASGGPGAAHLVNGLYDAYKDGVPVLAITGLVPGKYRGTEHQQEFTPGLLYEDMTVYNTTLGVPEATTKIVKEAMRKALARKKVSHIGIPSDLLTMPTTGTIYPFEPFLGTLAQSPSYIIEHGIEMLRSAQKPVFLIGRGAMGAEDLVRQLAEKIDAGVITSLPAKGLFPEDHPLGLGVIGGAGTDTSKEIAARSDLLFVIGSTWWPEPLYRLAQNYRIMQLDVLPENIGKHYHADLGIAGDTKTVLSTMIQSIDENKKPDWVNEIKKSKETWNRRVETVLNEAIPMEPAKVMRELESILPDNAILAVDTGDHTYWWGEVFRGKQQQVLLSWLWRSVGFGLPAAIGAKVAQPSRPVFAIVGDAGFSMLMAEFSTAVSYNLPITVIVLDNLGLGKELNEERIKFGFIHGVSYSSIDFARFAECCGGMGYRVNSVEELREVMLHAKNSTQPTLIHVSIKSTPLLQPLP